MSITTKITVLCDHPECNTWDAHSDHEEWSSNTAAKARSAAKRNGWTRVRDRDYCRQHSGNSHSKGMPDRPLITDHPGLAYPKGSVGYTEKICMDCGATLVRHKLLSR